MKSLFNNNIRRLIPAILGWLIFAACMQNETDTSWETISEKGEINVLATNNPIGYFLFKDQPMGFEYEILKDFAAANKLELNILLKETDEELTSALLNREADLAFFAEPYGIHDVPGLTASLPYLESAIVLLQLKKAKHSIEDIQELMDKTISISRESPYLPVLKEALEQAGLNTKVDFLDETTSPEEVFQLIADSTIPYAVVSKELALINQSLQPDIDASIILSKALNKRFKVREEDVQLKEKIDEHIREMSADGRLQALYKKYFSADRLKEFSTTSAPGDRMKYDALIRKFADSIQWDWRLLSALIWQESRYREDAQSWAGARGLMQLMPATAKRFGLKDINQIEEPRLNISLGTQYLAWLNNFWKDIPDEDTRIQFILASYNAGEGHVQDAQRLAAQYGFSPKKWEGHVATFLFNKSQPEFHQHPLVKHGYCRGAEPFFYIRSIIKRYHYYKQTYPEHNPYALQLPLSSEPAFALSIQSDGKLTKRPVFKNNPLFKSHIQNSEQGGLRTRDGYGLKVRAAFKDADTIFLRRDALQEGQQLFQEKRLFHQN